MEELSALARELRDQVLVLREHQRDGLADELGEMVQHLEGAAELAGRIEALQQDPDILEACDASPRVKQAYDEVPSPSNQVSRPCLPARWGSTPKPS